MNLRPPTFTELRAILVDLDAPQRPEVDAFHGVGQWTVDSEAARLAALARELPAHVLFTPDARPVIAFGVGIVRPGVLQTWLCACTGWQALNAEFVAVHAEATARLLALGGIHRIQVYSLAGRARVRPWIERLGYAHEGVQRAAGVQGEDFDLYGMVKGEG